jgi:hypothetical protein
MLLDWHASFLHLPSVVTPAIPQQIVALHSDPVGNPGIGASLQETLKTATTVFGAVHFEVKERLVKLAS